MIIVSQTRRGPGSGLPVMLRVEIIMMVLMGLQFPCRVPSPAIIVPGSRAVDLTHSTWKDTI